MAEQNKNAGARTPEPVEEWAMKNYCFRKNEDKLGLSVVGPAVGADNFEIKTSLITLIQNTI